MSNISNPGKSLSFHEIAPYSYISPGLSDGWMDLDISAYVGAQIVMANIACPNGNLVGVRVRGSSVDRK